ncbi:HNH endonuclease [Bacillus phage Staley]|uniref:DNA binding protein n=1 Tax=Bacillus phage Staley TaxID=1406792 RepID=U5Q1B8_9CAUD|nr:HNH endonuclease [Bacillus phage Staley]AGY48713.1 DNA binding protein [Bacillus phage Staley]
MHKELLCAWDKINTNAVQLKVKVSEKGCHEVISHKVESKGYFLISRNGKRYKAHRYSYMVNHGEIPKGLVVRHKCDNHLCINPEHLELGTIKDNVRDMIERGRAKGIHLDQKGECNAQAKLKLDDVIFIKSNLDIPNKILANKFDVKAEQIRRIKNGERWGHVVISQD